MIKLIIFIHSIFNFLTKIFFNLNKKKITNKKNYNTIPNYGI